MLYNILKYKIKYFLNPKMFPNAKFTVAALEITKNSRSG